VLEVGLGRVCVWGGSIFTEDVDDVTNGWYIPW